MQRLVVVRFLPGTRLSSGINKSNSKIILPHTSWNQLPFESARPADQHWPTAWVQESLRTKGSHGSDLSSGPSPMQIEVRWVKTMRKEPGHYITFELGALTSNGADGIRRSIPDAWQVLAERHPSETDAAANREPTICRSKADILICLFCLQAERV